MVAPAAVQVVPLTETVPRVRFADANCTDGRLAALAAVYIAQNAVVLGLAAAVRLRALDADVAPAGEVGFAVAAESVAGFGRGNFGTIISDPPAMVRLPVLAMAERTTERVRPRGRMKVSCRPRSVALAPASSELASPCPRQAIRK